jgi:hypothetical protein
MKGNIAINRKQLGILAAWGAFVFAMNLLTTGNVVVAFFIAWLTLFLSIGGILIGETYL